MGDASTTLSAPLRVVVMGASASVETSWRGGPRADLAYPRVIEAELLAAGLPATVHVRALPGRPRPSRARRVVTRGRAHGRPTSSSSTTARRTASTCSCPAGSSATPTASAGGRAGSGRATAASCVRPVWIGAGPGCRRGLTPGSTPRSARRRQRRTTAELARLLELVRVVVVPLVLVPTLRAPRAAVAAVVPRRRGADGDAQPHVRGGRARRPTTPTCATFPLAELVAERFGDEEPTPDGGHFTPGVHRAVGAAMAREILEWVEDGRSRGCTRHPLDASGPGRI